MGIIPEELASYYINKYIPYLLPNNVINTKSHLNHLSKLSFNSHISHEVVMELITSLINALTT